MNRTAFLALLSHWRRHPVQLVTLCIGLMLATALWSGVQAVNAEARASYDRAAADLGMTQSAVSVAIRHLLCSKCWIPNRTTRLPITIWKSISTFPM